MSRDYTHIVDLAKEVEPPEDGILTRTLFNDDGVKAVIFGFGQGEELSEHTASMPAYLKNNYKLSAWWQQTVTVAYEKAEGRRVLGQTADTGFQVGVQKTFPISLDQAWSLLSSRKGIACWLGKASRLSLAEGKTYKTEGGIEGEIRVVKPGKRVRLTWRRPGMKRPATLQITLAESSPEKTSIRVHLEHLPSQKVREEMKSHWRGVLGDLAESAASK